LALVSQEPLEGSGEGVACGWVSYKYLVGCGWVRQQSLVADELKVGLEESP